MPGLALSAVMRIRDIAVGDVVAGRRALPPPLPPPRLIDVGGVDLSLPA